MKLKLLLAGLLFTLSITSYSQNLFNKEADAMVENSSFVKLNKQSKTVEFIKFSENAISFKGDKNAALFLKKSLKLKDNSELKLKRKKTDKIGYTHFKFDQYCNDIRVDGKAYNLHYKNNKLISGNGEYINSDIKYSSPSISYSNALKIATNEIGATKYSWDTNQKIEKSKLGELVYIEHNNKILLSYKFDIFSYEPMSRYYVYIDAISGEFIKKVSRIYHEDRTGTAETMYNGTRQITTDFSGGIYTLSESGRGGGIITYDLNNGTDYASAVDFTDDDNFWNTTANHDNAAYDAHLGSEATYDYYLNVHSRNSFDDAGSAIISYVHYDAGYINAFWNGSFMTYGDGDGVNYFPFTCTDIIGHEITHGVTEHSANLVYAYESGALNESFSDIFGTCIDFYLNPGSANWILAEQISTTNSPLRSLEDPNSVGDPDTYQGNYWVTGSSDNGGVHTNSSVMNYWFYLLTNGGSGVNDNNDTYSVTGIGINKAAQIAYRNLTVYLTANSQFADARFYSIQSAIDLYGECSQEVISVTNAWYAVGVGADYNNSVIAEFNASQIFSCNIPATVNFYNLSVNGSAYHWDFGDGTTSTDANPSKTYLETGTYDVRLITNGSATCNNSDTIIKPEYITVTDIGGPITPSCRPSTTSSGEYGIRRFQFNTIDNATNSSTDDYQDYSCSFITTVSEGRPYYIRINTHPTMPENVWVWIDIDNNGTFDNTTELIYTSLNKTGIHEDTVIIPAGIVYDTPLRLRVASDSYPNIISDACSPSMNGQYEDYSVILTENNSIVEAYFISDQQTVQTGSTVYFSDKSLNLPTAWQWQFPGGTPSESTSKNPSVTYLSTGTYDVILTATNANGTNTITKSDYIKVSDTYTMCSDASSSSSNGLLYDSGGPSGDYSNSENCSFLINPGCADTIILSFNSFYLEGCCDHFQVYDGVDATGTLLLSANGPSIPSPVKATSGAMFIHFTTDGSAVYSGFEASWTSVLNTSGSVPVADFIISDSNPLFNSNVLFTDQTTEEPISWIWDFGDGNYSTEQNTTHFYESSGLMDVVLTSSTCAGSNTITKSLTVQLPPALSISTDTLRATVTVCNDSITVPLTLNNTGEGDLSFEINGNSTEKVELLALTYGVDYYEEYQHTISAINQYSTDYNLTEINTTDASVLETALDGKDIMLIVKQETGSSSVFTNFSSVLQTFVNNGGTVIFCGTSNNNSQYIFNTGLFSGNYRGYLNSGNLSVLNSVHAITNQLPSTINAQNATFYLNISDADAVRLVEYNGNYDVVTYREIGKGKVIYIGYDYYSYDNNASQIIANSIKWGGNKSLPQWLDIGLLSDTIAPGSSTSTDVKFNASGLNTGLYTTEIRINSNDPANQFFLVPCIFNVVGSPEIVLSESSYDFGDVFENGKNTDTLIISNSGCDTLFITNITSSLKEFTVDTTQLSVMPGDTAEVAITFAPTSLGDFNATLTLFNNDIDSTINLFGVGIEAPVIEINPALLNVTITECNNSITLPLTVYNTGGNELTFDLLGGGLVFDSTSIQHYSTTDALTNHTFSGLSNNTDSIYLNITINGNFDASSEFVDIYIDGNLIGQINPTVNNTDVTESFVLGGANVANWLSDGQIVVTLDNSSQVNSGYGTMLHQVQLLMKSSWITSSANTGTIEAGNSEIINVKFDANGLNSGLYTTEILINSNDPLNPQISVPCALNVDGMPEIVTSETSFDFGDVFENGTKTNTLLISNLGCDTLFINNITSTLSEYAVEPTFLSILPGDSAEIIITFAPTSVGNFNATLTLYNNDTDTEINLLGVGIEAPVINIAPSPLNALITGCNNTVTVPITITNNGGNDLTYEIISEEDFYDDFENGLNKWVWTGSWGVTTNAYQGTGALSESPEGNYGNSWNQYIELATPITVYLADSCKLSYWLDRNMESCCDYIRTQISVNGGSWQTLTSLNSTENWNLKTHDLSGYLNNGDLLNIRFEFTSDGSVTYDGVSIDNLLITGVSNSSLWLDIPNISDTITPGNSQMVNVTFDGNSLNSGSYSKEILVKSNDPVNTKIIVPCILNIEGEPEIVLSSTSYNFGNVFQNATKSDTVYISNLGCDTLFINNVISSLSEFTVNTSSASILPGETAEIIMTFAPTSLGNFNAELTIYNNDANTIINLSGVGTEAPLISISPNPLTASITSCENSVTFPLTISNNGGNELSFEILNEKDFYDDFENGLDNWTRNGNWGLTTNAYEGTRALSESPDGNYGDNWNQYIELANPLTVAQANNCRISYWLNRNMEDCCDYFNTQISINGGTWFSLNSLNGVETWDLKTFDLSGYINNGDILNIRFEFTSDGSVTYDGVSIDNFSVTGVGNSAQWYSFPIKSGTVSAGSYSAIDVQFNSNELAPGTYNDIIQVSSNDPLNSLLSVPCTFTVESSPTAPSLVNATETEILQGASTTLMYTGGLGETFNWYSSSCGGTLVGTGNNLSISPSVTTTYYGRWENSCEGSTCRSITITVNTTTSIEELGKMGVKIYPNPSNGIFIIELPKESPSMKLNIRNIEGKTLLNKSCNEIRNEIDLSNESPGVYIILIEVNNKVNIAKVILK